MRSLSLAFIVPGLAIAGEIAFDVGHEHRHADRAECLGHDLQRDGLAGAGGAGDQAVAVGKPGQQAELSCEALAIGRGCCMGSAAAGDERVV